MEINESNLTFSFADGTTVIKFDNTDFYRKVFNKLPGSKGVDIIAASNDILFAQCLKKPPTILRM